LECLKFDPLTSSSFSVKLHYVQEKIGCVKNAPPAICQGKLAFQEGSPSNNKHEKNTFVFFVHSRGVSFNFSTL
jgi:hypothetical protein